MFKESNTIFQEQVKQVFGKNKSENTDVVLNSIELILHSEFRDSSLITLYRTVGLEGFVNVIEAIGGKTVKLPKAYEIKDAIILSLCYYYKEMKGYDWKKIKALLPFDISSISYGTKIKSLNSYVKKSLREILAKMD